MVSGKRGDSLIDIEETEPGRHGIIKGHVRAQQIGIQSNREDGGGTTERVIIRREIPDTNLARVQQ